MNLKVIADNSEVTNISLNSETLKNPVLLNQVGYIGSQSKASNAQNILEAYCSSSKAILLDSTNRLTLEQIEALNIPQFKSSHSFKNLFDEIDFSFLYFTSGTTGKPVGAFKSKLNIEAEVKALTQLLQPYHIKRVIVTVPFIHLYGTLFGLMYPFLNGIDIVLKEHFLPHDLLELIDEHSMVVTTPLYIKALTQLQEHKTLSSSLFVSSTAPLDSQLALTFHQKFKADILQIFGSTETGGIAYKFNNQSEWKALNGVEIISNAQNELEVRSPFVSDLLYEQAFKKTNGKIATFDYIEKTSKDSFLLVGRSSKIFKIAGKRYSTIQIEEVLESIPEIERALVFVEQATEGLRGEYLEITLQSTKEFSVKEIKKILVKRISNLKFSLRLKHVNEIPKNAVGKKLRLQ